MRSIAICKLEWPSKPEKIREMKASFLNYYLPKLLAPLFSPLQKYPLQHIVTDPSHCRCHTQSPVIHQKSTRHGVKHNIRIVKL